MRPLAFVLFTLALFGLAASSLGAQANPFLSGNTNSASQSITPPPNLAGVIDPLAAGGELNIFQQALKWINDQQRLLHRQLSDSFGEFLRTGSAGIIWALLLASLLYGIVHTLLPGHRKGVIVAYFLSEDARIHHGLIAGLAFGILHVVGAMVLVGGAWLILAASFAQKIDQMTRAMELISGIAIIGLGFVMLIAKIRHLRHDHSHPDHSHPADDHSHHDHAHHDHHHDEGHHSIIKPARLAPMVIVSGIVPCPGSVLVMIAGFSQGVPLLAVAALIAMSLGIAITLIVIAFAAILFKRNALGLAERRLGHGLHAWVELGGVALIVLSGVLLLVGGQGI